MFDVLQEIVVTDPAVSDIEIIVASIDSYSSLQSLVKRTSVILSTVGPYYTYGKDLVG